VQIYRWKHNSPYLHFLGWLQGFVALLDSLIVIGSLGLYASNFELSISCYKAKKDIDKLRSIQKNPKSLQ
jgi:hypothetical protein